MGDMIREEHKGLVPLFVKLLPGNKSERLIVNMGCGLNGNDPINPFLYHAPPFARNTLKCLWIDPAQCKIVLPDQTQYIRAALSGSDVVAALVRRNEPKYMFILKVDIDSVDCQVVKEILDHGYRPRVIVVEALGCFPPPVSFSLIKRPEKKYENDGTHSSQCCLYSCSVQYVIDLGAQYGYIPWQIKAGDVVLIRRDVAVLTILSFDKNLTATSVPAKKNKRRKSAKGKSPLQSQSLMVVNSFLPTQSLMYSVYNPYVSHLPRWASEYYQSRPRLILKEACMLTLIVCNHSRIIDSEFILHYKGRTCEIIERLKNGQMIPTIAAMENTLKHAEEAHA